MSKRFSRNGIGALPVLVLTFAGYGQPSFINTWRVDASAVGDNTGLSWADAFTDLRDALLEAQVSPGNDQIWAAAGTYYPDGGACGSGGPCDQALSFNLLTDVSIYGGFLGLNHPTLPTASLTFGSATPRPTRPS